MRTFTRQSTNPELAAYELCDHCGKHIRGHYGGTEYRCDPIEATGIDAKIDARTDAAHKDATRARAYAELRSAIYTHVPNGDDILDALDTYARGGSQAFLDKLIDAARLADQPAPDAPDNPARPHIVGGEFQSDKYPTTPRGKVPLSVKDPTAQDLLWEYAQRRRKVDAEFADDLEYALTNAGYKRPPAREPFAEVWRRMQARGFQYGPDALENVKLGFELGRGTWDPGDGKPIPDAHEPRSCDDVDLAIALDDLGEAAIEYTYRKALRSTDQADKDEEALAAHTLEGAAYRLALAELDTEHPCSEEDLGLFYKDAIAHLKKKGSEL